MLTRPLVLVFVSSFGFSTSFYLMLSVVPLYATSVGAGGGGAGLATGALMLSTVAAELVTPLLVSRFGYRAVFAAGFVLLGAPAFALGAVPTAPGTRRWSALRPDYGFYTLMSEHEELAVG
jgi:MFS family permease